MSYRGGDAYDDRREDRYAERGGSGGADRGGDRYDDRRGGGSSRYDDRRGSMDRRDRYDDRRGGGDRYDDRRDDGSYRGGGGGRGGFRDRGDRGGGRNSRVRLYVGRLSSNTREPDLEDLFARYGPLRRVDMKTGFAFVEYNDELDAKDACEKLDGYKVDGERLVVEYAKDKPRPGERGGDRDGGDRENGRAACCYNCGKFDHWARDCPDPPGRGARSQRYDEGKCFGCGQPGHRARDCPNSGGGDGGYGGRGRDVDRDGDGARRSASPRRASSGSPRKRSPSPRGGDSAGHGAGSAMDESSFRDAPANDASSSGAAGGEANWNAE